MIGRWTKKVPHHDCRLPTTPRHGIGSQWRCHCGTTWQITAKSKTPDGRALTDWRTVQDKP